MCFVPARATRPRPQIRERATGSQCDERKSRPSYELQFPLAQLQFVNKGVIVLCRDVTFARASR